jgi:hypothetical protein
MGLSNVFIRGGKRRRILEDWYPKKQENNKNTARRDEYNENEEKQTKDEAWKVWRN